MCGVVLGLFAFVPYFSSHNLSSMATKTVLVSDVSGKMFPEQSPILGIRWDFESRNLLCGTWETSSTGLPVFKTKKKFSVGEIALTKEELAEIFGLELRTQADRMNDAIGPSFDNADGGLPNTGKSEVKNCWTRPRHGHSVD